MENRRALPLNVRHFLGRSRSISYELVLEILVFFCLLILIVGPVSTIFYGALVQTGGSLGADNLVKLADAANLKVIYNTLSVATLATTFAFFLGFPLAFVTARTSLPHSRIVEALSSFPFYLNPLAGAVGWILLASPSIGLANRIIQYLLPSSNFTFDIYTGWGISLALGVFYSPYFFLFCSSALRAMDPELEEASRVSGAGEWHTILHVTLPLIAPALISAVLLVFVLSASEFGVALILGWTVNYYVLATRIYALVMYPPLRFGEATALSLVLLSVTLFLTLISRRKLNVRKYVTIGGKGYHPRKMNIGRWRYPVFMCCLILQFTVLLLPILLMIIVSFSENYASFVFTLDNYREILFGWESEFFWRATSNSLIISVLGATLAMLLAMVISYIGLRTKLSGRRILDYVSSLSLAVPGVVMGVGMLWFWVGIPIAVYGTIWILIIACIGKFLAYGVRSLSSSMVQVSSELEESSRVCGASLLRTLGHITIPLIKGGFYSGWVLLFIVFFRETAMVVLLYTYQTITLSVLLVELFDSARYTIFSAIGIIQMAIIWLIVFLFGRVFKVGVKVAEA
jgi:iron(III) transport system permease protein